MATTVDKDCGNANGLIVDRFIKPIASTIFAHLTYFMDGPGPLIAVSVPHKVFPTVILVYE